MKHTPILLGSIIPYRLNINYTSKDSTTFFSKGRKHEIFHSREAWLPRTRRCGGFGAETHFFRPFIGLITPFIASRASGVLIKSLVMRDLIFQVPIYLEKLGKLNQSFPTGSMYGVSIYIYHKNQPNVGKNMPVPWILWVWLTSE